MAASARKRRSPSSIVDQDDSNNSSPTKRPRRKNDNDNDDENDEDYNEKVSDEEEEVAVDDDAADADAGTAELPVAVEKRIKKINLPNKPAEAGIISSVYVENFMCHRKLKVDLCKNVNFIHGQNGSGKSAILAAIQICLGAGARRTHRARNLKELIRKESSENSSATAKIRVTVLNMGDDAFKHEIYGDYITVERSISLGSGYNGYKLLDKDKVEKSRSKKELDMMLDHLNIQVENPVAILDQEDAKKFLLGKATDKYAFFMKATELERMDRIYASTKDVVDDLQISKGKICNNLQNVKDHVDELKYKYEQHQQLQKLELKVQEYNVQFCWAFFTTCQTEYEGAEQHMASFQQKAEKKQLELTQVESQANTPDDEEQIKRDKMKDLMKEAEEQTKEKRELEGELKCAKAPLKQMANQLKQIKRNQKTAEKKLASAKSYLEEVRDQILQAAGSAESEEGRLTTIIKETEEELRATKEKSMPIKQAVSNALRSYEELEPAVESAKMSYRDKKSQHDAVCNKLRELESSKSKNSNIAIFGQRCVQVRQMVDDFIRQHKFKGEVLGPIGSYLKVVAGKGQYAKLAEHAIGNGTLDRFIVTNDHDREVFQKQIRDRVGCRQDCGVIQVKIAPRYNIASAYSAGDIETVASTINIDNDLVFNCLVDHGRIDQKALTPSKEISEQKLLISNPDGKYTMKDKSIKEVYFLPSGDRWMVKNGMVSMVSNEKAMRQTIGVDKTAAIEEAKLEADHLSNELQELREEEQKLSREHTDYKRQWNLEQRAFKANATLIQTLTNKIDEVKSELETLATNVEVDTTEYEEDVTNAERELDALKEEEAQLIEEIEKKEPEISGIENRLDEATMRNEKVLEDMQVAEDDLNNYLQKLSQKQEVVEKKRAKLLQLQEIVAKHQEKLDELEADRNKALLQARKVHYKFMIRQQRKAKENAENGEDETQVPADAIVSNSTPTNISEEDLEAIEPIMTDKDPSYYETRLKRAKQKAEKERERRFESSDDDAATAFEKYARAKKDLDGKMRRIDEIIGTVKKLNKDMKYREQLWRQFRQYLSNLTDMKFDEMLQLNDSSGEVEFNHETQELNLIVQKDKTNDSSQTRDVKALSGGERSYTTMCLLLALGETLETPFRILDEFDVFLDPQVRKLVIEALIHVAKKLKHRQFIFITPQDLSGISSDPMLKILKMSPPLRNQVAGGLSQHTLDFPMSQSS